MRILRQPGRSKYIWIEAQRQALVGRHHLSRVLEGSQLILRSS
jgi:hypothetical protein